MGSAPFRCRAVFLDLDGTLVSREHAIGDRDRAAVAAAQAAGVRVYVNTGRSVAGALRAYEALRADSPVFCCNGAVVHDPVAGEDIERHVLPAATMAAAVEMVQARGGALFAFVAGRVVTHDCDEPGFALLADLMARAGLDRLAAVGDLPRADVTKLWLLGEASQADHLAEATTGPHTRWIRPPFGDAFAQAGRVLSSATAVPSMKRAALEWVAHTEGLGMHEMVAVGDHHNDLEALQAAGVGVAVRGAPPEVLAVCQRVVGGPGTGGVAELLEALSVA